MLLEHVVGASGGMLVGCARRVRLQSALYKEISLSVLRANLSASLFWYCSFSTSYSHEAMKITEVFSDSPVGGATAILVAETAD